MIVSSRTKVLPNEECAVASNKCTESGRWISRKRRRRRWNHLLRMRAQVEKMQSITGTSTRRNMISLIHITITCLLFIAHQQAPVALASTEHQVSQSNHYHQDAFTYKPLSVAATTTTMAAEQAHQVIQVNNKLSPRGLQHISRSIIELPAAGRKSISKLSNSTRQSALHHLQLANTGNHTHSPLLANLYPVLSDYTSTSGAAASTKLTYPAQASWMSPLHHDLQMHSTSSVDETQQGKKQKPKKTSLLEKICIGTSNRLSRQHNKTDHYQNLVERYKDCTYVIGNLEITWLDKSTNEVAGGELDLSFLESIREITGYLLIAHAEMDKIRMPNLQIIRGRDLFKMNHEQNEEFAMILIENELKTLELPNLREILAGSVGSYNNENLCHIRTLNWDEILNWPTYRTVFVYNGTEPECPPCSDSCQGGCWGEGVEMCQKISKTNCSPHCKQGRCFGPSAAECCHSFCAGGCVGPKQTDCLACRNFYDDGACIHECPSMQRYNPSKFLWEADPNGKYAFGATCVKDCPDHLLRDAGACVRTCPPGKRNVNGECQTCPQSQCPKNCQGVEVVHSGNIDQLINCTVIEGSITILDTSFNGYTEVHGNSNNTIRYKPMHPSRLDVFKTVHEITGYLHIQANHSDFKNLSCFRNLHTLGGSQTTDMFHTLSIVKTSLVSLNLRSLRKVINGKISIEDNQDLCFADTIDWLQTNITKRQEITVRNNGESSKCQQLGLQCHEQCARDGCWGPGPDECLSCKNHILEEHCVENCSSIHGALSFYNGSNTCIRCHPECKGGCDNDQSHGCWQCKNVKDGPYCIPKCPKHKYNKSGTCAECDKSCADGGCSGPSNKLGEGGCNSCGKAVIQSTNDSTIVAHCIRAEEPCPDGYYQEYVGPQAVGLLKSSSGQPVCRKCHHRCKTCTGMGSHMSLCECAKFLAGEQCEDGCPRDYFADKQLRQCVKCSPECNGCSGPTDLDCDTCRVYRIYLPTNSSATGDGISFDNTAQSLVQGAQVHGQGQGQGGYDNIKKMFFKCTSQCPPGKPYRISERNMLDPYCSESPGVDPENPSTVALSYIYTISLLFTCVSFIAVAFTICIKYQQSQNEKDKTVKLTMHLSGIDDVEPLNPSNMKPNLAPLRSIKETELRKGKILGKGFGGTVYQGFWRPEGQEHEKPRPVAIKVLRDNGEHSNMNKEFLDEAYIMASANHPNLVRLLAVCMTPNHLMLVTQLMPLGCLLEYVKKHRKEIAAKNLLEWCKQIAKGMDYLEQHRMVHRDLALRNVLLQTSGRALISDFGLAKFLELDQSEYHSGGGRLPIKWLAPECIRERKFTHKSDVWAFGVTVWELLTFGMIPFEEYETKDVPLAIEKGARLHQPSYMSAEVYKVMYSCWFYNPSDRPNFRALTQNFVNFARDPERYLACGGKGIEYANMTTISVRDEMPAIKSNCSDVSEEDEMDEYAGSDDVNSMTEEDSPTALTAMPDLTPTTNNRMNEMFGFDMRLHHQHQHQRSSHPDASDQHHQQAGKSPSFKKHMNLFQGEHDDVFAKSHGIRHHHLPITRNNLMHDANNNNSCWSMHHTISTNSLGQKSEQPTDAYDYLLPSPCTDELNNHFSNFYSSTASTYNPKSQPVTPSASTATTISLRDPPHSAGFVGVNNEEYFMTRLNYVNNNQQAPTSMSSKQIINQPDAQGNNGSLDGGHLSASNGNLVPHSLV